MDEYTIMPTKLYYDTRLEWSDRNIMSVIITKAQYNKNQITDELSYTDICNYVNNQYTRAAVIQSMKKLISLKYIEVIKQPPPHKNQYRVLIDIPTSKKIRSKRTDKPIQQSRHNDIDYSQFTNRFDLMPNKGGEAEP